MKKVILLLIFITLSIFGAARENKPHKDGYAADMGRNLFVGTIQELAKNNKLPDLQKTSEGFAKDAGSTCAKEFAQIVSNPSTKSLTDDVAKNAGSTAATALAGAVSTSTKIVAGVATAGMVLHAADKVVDRILPNKQEKANRAEAAVRTFQANSSLEDMKAEREAEHDLTRCLNLHPKQIRNSHGCPGNCTSIYRKLSLLGQYQKAREKLANLKNTDDYPISTMSAKEAEKEVRQSFAENQNGPMRKMTIAEPAWIPCLWDTYTMELPEKAMQLLEKRSLLSPKRFSRVFAETLQSKYSDLQASQASPLLDKNGYPSHININLKRNGKKMIMHSNPVIK